MQLLILFHLFHLCIISLVFGELTFILRTGEPILMELIDMMNYVVNFLSQMIFFRWLTFLLASLTLTRSLLLYLFLSSDTSICSTKAFFPFDHSDHVVVSISTDLLSKWKQDALFYGIVYDYSCGDCIGVCYDLRDVPWEDIFKLLVLSVHRNLYFFHFYQQKKCSESQKGY